VAAGGFAAARVAAARHLGPGFRNVALEADPTTVAAAGPGAEVAIRFRDAGGRPHERPYSAWKREGARLEVCVSLHGLGPGSAWAARCAPGDEVEIAVVHARPVDLVEGAGAHVFLGDETSVAAADALMRELPPRVPARAAFEIASPDSRWPPGELAPGLAPSWIPRDGRPGAALAAWLDRGWLECGPHAAAYVTGETWLCSTVAARLVRELGFPRERVRALPFWKRRASS